MSTIHCPYCDAGKTPVRETLPNGEVIWAHWEGGVCHECTNPDSPPFKQYTGSVITDCQQAVGKVIERHFLAANAVNELWRKAIEEHGMPDCTAVARIIAEYEPAEVSRG